MGPPVSPRTKRLLLYGSLVLVGLLSLGRLLQYGPVPWAWVGGFAVGTGVLAGPVTWVVRDRIPADRREHLTLAAFVAGMVCIPVVLAIGLLTGWLLPLVDASVFGGLIGFAVATLAERTVVPKRLRGSSI